MKSVFLSPALKFVGIVEDIGCDVDLPFHLQTQIYPELNDHDPNTCHTLHPTITGKLQIIYTITNAICSQELNHFGVKFGGPEDSFIHVTFAYSRNYGSSTYKECPATVGASHNEFNVECTLGCASDLRIFIEWLPGSQLRNVHLCDVELLTSVRNVEPSAKQFGWSERGC